MELFILKLLDGLLGTAKNIFLFKNKELLAALAGTISTFFYLTMMVKLVKIDGINGILIICAASFFGTYFPILFSKLIEKQKIYVYNITPDSNDNGKKFADNIRENNIPVLTYKGYNKEKESVLCCKIFSESKKQSSIISEMIPEEFMYYVSETKSSFTV